MVAEVKGKKIGLEPKDHLKQKTGEWRKLTETPGYGENWQKHQVMAKTDRNTRLWRKLAETPGYEN